jgi:hypothetical protein
METNRNRYRNQEIELLSDLIYFYDRSQSEYNRNMENIISLTYHFLNRNRDPSENRRNDIYRRYRNNTSRSPFMPVSPLFSYNNFLSDNQNPGLTNIEIDRATEIVPYETEMRDTICPISFEEFSVGENVLKIQYCGHIFKIDSIRNWFRRNKRCPICRYDLTTNIREINFDISLNRITEPLSQRQHPMSDVENNIIENINRIFQNITFPEENTENTDSALSRYVFEFPIYFDVSNNTI